MYEAIRYARLLPNAANLVAFGGLGSIDAERVEAALQHVERVIVLVRHAVSQGRLSQADAQKIIDAATTFGAAVIF